MSFIISYVFVFGVAMTILGQLEGFKGASVSRISDGKSQNSGNSDKDIDFKNVVIFVNSCTGQKVSYEIENIRQDCYKVKLNKEEPVIQTQPEDLHLVLFDKPDCPLDNPSVKQFDYTYSSHKQSDNRVLPFNPVSFLIAKR